MNIIIKWDIDRFTVYQSIMSQKNACGLLRMDEITMHSIDLLATMAWDEINNKYFDKILAINHIMNMPRLRVNELIDELRKQIGETHYNMFLGQMFGENVVLQK